MTDISEISDKAAGEIALGAFESLRAQGVALQLKMQGRFDEKAFLEARACILTGAERMLRGYCDIASLGRYVPHDEGTAYRCERLHDIDGRIPVDALDRLANGHGAKVFCPSRNELAVLARQYADRMMSSLDSEEKK